MTPWEEAAGQKRGVRGGHGQAAIMLWEFLSETNVSAFSHTQVDTAWGTLDPDNDTCDSVEPVDWEGAKGCPACLAAGGIPASTLCTKMLEMQSNSATLDPSGGGQSPRHTSVRRGVPPGS